MTQHSDTVADTLNAAAWETCFHAVLRNCVSLACPHDWGVASHVQFCLSARTVGYGSQESRLELKTSFKLLCSDINKEKKNP